MEGVKVPICLEEERYSSGMFEKPVLFDVHVMLLSAFFAAYRTLILNINIGQ
jgi:hypothetical protein